MQDKVTLKKSKLSATQKAAATAGLLAALAPATTDADVIVVDDNPIIASAFDGDGSVISWDVDGANGAEFEFRVRSSSFFSSSYFSSNSYRYSRNAYGILRMDSAGLNGQGMVNTSGGARVFGLAQSVNVGPTLSGSYQWGASGVSYRSMVRFDSFSYRSQPGGASSNFFGSGFSNSAVNFVEGANYIGFRFDNAGNTHYGWAQLDVAGASITVSRWAYESDADTAIHIGTIPEPSSFALLGLGAAGILGWRRRRNKDSS